MTLTINVREEQFAAREADLDLLIQRFQKKSAIFSNVRMVLFLASALSLGFFFFGPAALWLLIAGLIFLIAFVVIIAVHLHQNRELKHLSQLRVIQGEYRARTLHMFDKLPDNGNDFLDRNHDYSADLDLFGPKSLFHLINVSSTYYGRKKLRDLLLVSQNPLLTVKSITDRQAAVEELASRLNDLQDFEARGRLSRRNAHSPRAFIEYSRIRPKPESAIKKVQLWIAAILSSILVASVLISAVTDFKVYYVSLIVLVIQLLWVAVNYRKFKSAFESIEGLHPELYSYRSLFEWIEKCDIHSSCLKSIRDELVDKDNVHGGAASKQLKRLHIICLFIQARSQPLLFFILNSLFLYDLYCFYFLEKWVNESGKMLPGNLEMLGNWEALMSLSMTKMIYPECSFPTFVTELEGRKACFNAKKMGHPLIPVIRQVRNDFSLPEGIALITGSNMSGKTTLLRTVGINTVLAYSGGVCCVEYFQLGLMRIGSSMRISDSLEEGLSTFYAELLRIEKIINMSKTKEPLLFLIDEIFRGTNSRDRTEGAQLVLKHLSRDWVIGLMSTHDYQLCEINKENSGKVLFYYFSERYDEDGIHFDYLLSSGVSTSANAKYLMKMVGID